MMPLSVPPPKPDLVDSVRTGNMHEENIHRQIGAHGERSLVLRIQIGEKLQQEVALHQAWEVTLTSVTSVVAVQAGSPLAGTEVRIREQIGGADLSVEISVPGSRRTFTVGFPYNTAVFGSEFTYEDFRFFLAPGVAVTSDKGIEQWDVRYPGLRAEHRMHCDYPLPKDVIWFDDVATSPFRRVISTDFEEMHEKVVMPRCMRAERLGVGSAGENSVMLLGEVVIV